MFYDYLWDLDPEKDGELIKQIHRYFCSCKKQDTYINLFDKQLKVYQILKPQEDQDRKQSS